MRVKPGEELGFVQVLSDAHLFPLPVGRRRPHPGRPVATPFLIIPAFPFDQGTNRQLPASPARLHSSGIRVLNGQNNPTLIPLIGEPYTLVADVTNRGSGFAYGGVAEFYVGTHTLF